MTVLADTLPKVEGSFEIKMITPKSFEDVLKVLPLGNKEDFLKKQSRQFVDFFLYSASDKEETVEIVLYWEGWQQAIPNDKNLQTYFEEKGFKFAPYHPSSLIESARRLIEPGDVKWDNIDIVLPFHQFLSFKNDKISSFLILTSKIEGKRSIDFIPINQGFFDFSSAFLLQRI